jgi:CRISPR-associated protein Cmx8
VAKNVKATVDQLTLSYQLAELPTSQHRAGLAGLVMVIRWLTERNQPDFQQKVSQGALCRLIEVNDQSVQIELNQAGIEALFDEIYQASTEEQGRNQVLKNSRTKEVIEPLRVEEIEETDDQGKQKSKKLYIYPVTVPGGSFLADYDYDRSFDGKNGLWIKLWRDMIWSILRGVPATRKPFEARADGNYNDDAICAWKQLIQPEDFTVDLPSTYFLGAQAYNAENIPFKDRARFQFLLHFWPFAVQIYIPAVIDNEGKRNFVGYAIAIPDVADLEWFCEEFPQVLSERTTEKSGYRPRDCLVDLAIESALDMMKRLRDRLKQTLGDQSIRSSVLGIDVLHTEKQGNNVRLLNVARLDPESEMLDRYAQAKEAYWSPLFRRQYILNLVNRLPWYTGFDALLCTLPYERSIEDKYFRHDVLEKIKSLNTGESTMSESLEPLIFSLVRNYVNRKLKSKHDLEWKQDWKSLSTEELEKHSDYRDYKEKKMKIAKGAFLDVRSRTEKEDFINYFVSSLCSVPQYMKQDDYVALTKALYADHNQVRTLTLLALSANS